MHVVRRAGWKRRVSALGERRALVESIVEVGSRGAGRCCGVDGVESWGVV